YLHVGPPGPKYAPRDLTDEEKARYPLSDYGYVKFEPYPAGERLVGRFWTQAQLDAVDNGCRTVTTMGQALADTYASDPGFYSGTFCAYCGKHFPVGAEGDFVWDGTFEKVGT
ncbi:MAG: hypothetical protein Q8S13_05335, partial [Dehalococcoidia bacterium]|nr:hypothetical protein [Dehalococcoidia bacterium]